MKDEPQKPNNTIMLTIAENNIDVEFLTTNLIHVTLKEGGVLSTQLLRELSVVSKVKHGKSTGGYIFTVKNSNAIEEDACRTCRKAERITSEIKVAVICNKPCSRNALKNDTSVSDDSKLPKLFNDFSSALSYVEGHLELEPNL